MKKILIVFAFLLVFSLSYFVISQTTGEFQVGNEAPSISNFEVQESTGSWDSTTFDTHDDTTSLRWTINDANPDSLTTTICIGTGADPYTNTQCNVVNYQFTPDSPGTTQTYTYGTDPTGTLQGTSDTINFVASNCIADPCTKTYYVDIIVDDSQDETVSINSFELTDSLPQFTNVYASDSALIIPDNSCVDYLPQNCLINPTQGDYTSINTQLRITDADEDCSDLTHTAKIILCMVDAGGAELCDETNNADYVYDLSFSQIIGSECDFLVSIPVSDTRGIEFFKAPGNYKMFITATSQAGAPTTPWLNYEWEYNSAPGFDYGSSVFLGDRMVDGGDDIQLGNWNPGLSISTISNHGNVILNLNWEATDASTDASTCDGHTATCWDLSTASDLVVDDDNTQGETTETELNEVIIPETPTSAIFEPAGGLQICDVMTCDSAIGETLDTYFHIKPPLGLSTGTYQTDITITI